MTAAKQTEKASTDAIEKATSHAAETINTKIDALRKDGKLADIEAPEVVADRMVDDILNASDLDGVLGGTAPIAQLVGQIVRIVGVNFRPSDVRENDYGVFHWQAVDGREGVSTNGGLRLVAQLAKFAEVGLPVTVKVGSASVEYEPGHFGDTYFFVKPEAK